MTTRPIGPRRVLAFYFAGAYGISWGGILAVLASRRFELTALGQPYVMWMFAFMLLGPSVSGLALTAWIEGRTGLRALVERAARWRVRWTWYAVALGTSPLLLLPVLWCLGTFADPVYLPRFQWSLFVIGLIAGCFEEIGWTGFATPRLLQGRPVAQAGLMLGVPWALWHLPADLSGNLATMGWAWPAWFAVYWLATLPAYRLLMTWLYGHTRSLLLAMLMHAGYTGWMFVLTPQTTVAQGLVWQAAFAAGLWGVAAVALRARRCASGVRA